MLALSRKGCVLFRNAVGVGYSKQGDIFKYGLCEGSSDIIGITPIVITADMVGKTIGAFTAVEVKRSATGYGATDKQLKFIAAIQKRGGLAGVAFNIETAEGIVNEIK